MDNIVLIGFMGSGKSTIAKVLSKKLNMKIADMDGDIEREEGRTISDIFSEDGESYFRSLEKSYLNRASEREHTILSTGGGVVVTDGNIDLLHKIGTVIFLQADVEHILNNVKGDTKRPLLQGGNVREKIIGMLEVRDPIYLSAANVIIQTSGKSVMTIVEEIISIL